MSNSTAFTKEVYELAYPPGIENHYWHYARVQIICAEIKKQKLSHLKFLEVGCGTGSTVKLLRGNCLTVYGVELAPVQVDRAIEEFAFTNTNATELDQSFRNSIEGIMLLDVIEHIEDPVKFINELLEKFPNAQHIIITVPARQELWSNYDVFARHVKRYHISDQEKLGKDLQLKLIRNRYFFHAMYIPFKLILKLAKERKTTIKAPKGISKLIHRLLAFYLFLNFRLMPGTFRGTSLIGIFQKN